MVFVDHFFDVAEPQAEAFHVVAVTGWYTVEFLEYTAKLFTAHTQSLVGHSDTDSLRQTGRPDTDYRRVGRVLEGVVEQIVQNVGDVQFVGVNVKNDKAEAVAFERKAGVTYPSLHDQPGELLLRFRRIVPQTPPTTLIVDREGRIAGFFAGSVRISDLLPPVQSVAAERV